MLASYLVDCVLSENIAFSGWGGAFYGVDSPYSQFVMLSSSFVNNRAYSSYFTQSHGGALMITSKITVNISDCFFANNSALPYLHVVPLTYRYPYSCSCCCCCCCPDSCCPDSCCCCCPDSCCCCCCPDSCCCCCCPDSCCCDLQSSYTPSHSTLYLSSLSAVGKEERSTPSLPLWP